MNGDWVSPKGPTNNYAAAGSNIGIQANEVRNSNIYLITQESSPQQLYEVGVRYLEDGAPRKAEDLISQAISHDLDNAEVRFHWVLAMFSKRSFRDLSAAERGRLETAVEKFGTYPLDDRFTVALQAIGSLIRLLGRGDHSGEVAARKVEAVEEEILNLTPDLAGKVNRHFDLVLSATTKTRLWRKTCERAEQERFGNDRAKRVWTYFEVDPTAPRLPSRREEVSGPEVHPAELAGVAAFILASTLLGWRSIASGNLGAILAFLVLVAAGAVAVRDAYAWRYRSDRITLLARRHFGDGLPDAPMNGDEFAPQVRRAFRRYFSKYRPPDKDPDEWLRETSGVRARLSAELAETYREQRTSVDEIRWLIRFHAVDVRKRYLAGTLFDFADRDRVSPLQMARCVGLAVVALAAAVQLFRLVDIGGQVAMVGAGLSGALAMVICYRAYTVLRGVRDDATEARHIQGRREQEFARWTQKLEKLRPSEQEMETWLLSDITVLIDKVLREGKWDWSDVISHAVIRQPARGAVGQCVTGGPWRYSRYQLRVYLVTVDGVREVTAALAFKTGTFGEESRENFQLDNITSVKVTEEVAGGRVLTLMLNNGDPREIRVTESVPSSVPIGMETSDDLFSEGEMTALKEPDPEVLERVRLNLDATGFEHALRMLEGIGADGKGWIERHARA
ncbi:hypothetical protein ACFVJS_21600 [Nocardioides sp. NPDC057772]|uniref:hypothetical protein n=1 Tax=Nocardioides sp. NPDC057772 TaxID=3346245 RepID=UPI00366B9D05